MAEGVIAATQQRTPWPEALSPPTKPSPDSLNGLAHVRGGTCVAKPHELTAVDRIEVDTGGRGDTSVFEHALGKIETVGCESRNVRIEVECPIDWQKPIKTRLRQLGCENSTILL